MIELFFKIRVTDITDEILAKSLYKNVYSLDRSPDGKYVVLKFSSTDVPAAVFRGGYEPVDPVILRAEMDLEGWSSSTEVENTDLKDSDGTPLLRTKITSSGWHYQMHGLEFSTSDLASIYSKKDNGVDFGFTTIKCYDENDQLLETQEECDTSAVKTVIDWEPTHDYEIVGGMFRQASIPASDVRLWVIGVPDVLAMYGGSKLFAANLNLKFVGLEEGVRVDGRAPKYLTYNNQSHTNKLRMILKHDPGFKHKVYIVFEIFRE